MSERIDNSKFRKNKLKNLILKLHRGASEAEVRNELLSSLSSIPYGEVVEVEQELITEGLPEEEVLKLCDAHSAVLKGNIDLSGKGDLPPGHPVDIMIQENNALKEICKGIREGLLKLTEPGNGSEKLVYEIIAGFNSLMDVDKHYLRKEYLFFPYLEKTGVTGPPKVMWGKHDEIRELLKGSLEVLRSGNLTIAEIEASAELVMEPALRGVEEMTVKEEEILFPMMLDTLTDADWHEISRQTPEIGYCLIDPGEKWMPEGREDTSGESNPDEGRIQLPSGSFSGEELLAILNTLPADITFVDKNDRVKFFSQTEDRIFQRNRAILNRDVRFCHPPASVHIVEKILEDFRSGRENRAPFWINMKGRMIHIEYFALRNGKGDYLGTLEVTQDLTGYRKLDGEQRILSYK